MISFSGIDGAGKTTQIELLQLYYDKIGKKHKTIWGRGGWTPGLEFIKNIVRTDKKLDSKGREEYRNRIHANPLKKKILLIGAILDLYLFFGIYYRLLNYRDYILICDRYIWDTYVDFKVNYPIIDFEKWIIWKILIQIIPHPDNSFMLTISPDESIRRGLEKNEFFIEPIETKKNKIKLYFELVSEGKWTNYIDGGQSKEIIFQEIIRAMEK
jgi:thymidylate kinase